MILSPRQPRKGRGLAHGNVTQRDRQEVWDAVDQAASSIGNYPIDWGTVIFWIVVVVVGFWLLGKIIQFFE
jgi:hypothetical protein